MITIMMIVGDSPIQLSPSFEIWITPGVKQVQIKMKHKYFN